MITTGLLEPLDLTAGDWARVVELLGTYTDLALDLIDASIVAIAERLGQTTIATFDYRDVRVVRPPTATLSSLSPDRAPSLASRPVSERLKGFS
jgi:hypothetical protein